MNNSGPPDGIGPVLIGRCTVDDTERTFARNCHKCANGLAQGERSERYEPVKEIEDEEDLLSLGLGTSTLGFVFSPEDHKSWMNTWVNRGST
jgi:hypothetical protein